MEGDEQYGKPRRSRRPQAVENHIGSEAPTADSLRRKEKFNSILIITIGCLTLIFGLGGMWYGLANPFENIIAESAAEQAKLAAAEQAALQAEMTKDTDGDGLTDYVENNTYGTNPYLKDSNGDGIDDKTSIERGIEPNCSEGQICFSGASAADTATSAATSSSAAPQLQTSLAVANPTISADYIRSLLLKNGTTADQLADVTDAELIAQFKEYLADNPDVVTALKAQGLDVDSFTATSSSTASNVSLSAPSGTIDVSSLNIKSADDLKQLSGAQIRQLMISAGASSVVLSAVGDEELKQIFIKQLEAKTQ